MKKRRARTAGTMPDIDEASIDELMGDYPKDDMDDFLKGIGTIKEQEEEDILPDNLEIPEEENPAEEPEEDELPVIPLTKDEEPDEPNLTPKISNKEKYQGLDNTGILVDYNPSTDDFEEEIDDDEFDEADPKVKTESSFMDEFLQTEEKPEESGEVPLQEELQEELEDKSEEPKTGILAYDQNLYVEYIPMDKIKIIGEVQNHFADETVQYPIVVQKTEEGYVAVAGGVLKCNVIPEDGKYPAEFIRMDYVLKTQKLSEWERYRLLNEEIDYAKKYHLGDIVQKVNNLTDKEMGLVLAYRDLIPELFERIGRGLTAEGASKLSKLTKKQQRTVNECIDLMDVKVLTRQEIAGIEKLAESGDFSVEDCKKVTTPEVHVLTNAELQDYVTRAVTWAMENIGR